MSPRIHAVCCQHAFLKGDKLSKYAESVDVVFLHFSLSLTLSLSHSLTHSLTQVDAKRKGVKLAAHYCKFVDLISEFSQTYPRLAQLNGGGGASLCNGGGSASLHTNTRSHTHIMCAHTYAHM